MAASFVSQGVLWRFGCSSVGVAGARAAGFGGWRRRHSAAVGSKRLPTARGWRLH